MSGQAREGVSSTEDVISSCNYLAEADGQYHPSLRVTVTALQGCQVYEQAIAQHRDSTHFAEVQGVGEKAFQDQDYFITCKGSFFLEIILSGGVVYPDESQRLRTLAVAALGRL